MVSASAVGAVVGEESDGAGCQPGIDSLPPNPLFASALHFDS